MKISTLPRSALRMIALAVVPHLIHAASPPAAPPPEEIGVEFNATFSASGGVRLEALGLVHPEMRTQEVGLDLKFTCTTSATSASGIGLKIQRTVLRMDRGAWSLPVPDRFQSTGLEYFHQSQLGEKWSGLFSLSAGWRTAGTTGLGGRGFGAVFTALGLYSAGPTLTLAVGAVGDTLAEGSSVIVPAVGLDWRFAPQWRLALGVPRTGLIYAFSERLELGLVAEATWDTYWVDRKARVPALPGYALTGTKLEYTDARAGLQINWQVTPRCQLDLNAGVIGYRSLEYPERNLKLKTDGAGGGYAAAGFTFNF